jgi:hypothetical protein
MNKPRALFLCAALLFLTPATGHSAEERTERFDREPRWESINSHSTAFGPREVRQNFGFSMTAHAGGRPGELGGFITPAAEPAYYAKGIPEASFADPLSASGTFAATGRSFRKQP